MFREQQFFSYNKLLDWEKGFAVNMDLSEQGLRIGQTHKYAFGKLIRTTELKDAGEICDFTVGDNGKLYLLDEFATVWEYDAWNGLSEKFIHSGSELLGKHAAICTAGDLFYLVDPFASVKIMALSLANGQPLWDASVWEGRTLYPLAAAVNREGELFVLIAEYTLANETNDVIIPAGGRLTILQYDASGRLLVAFGDEDFTIRETLRLPHALKRFALAAGAPGRLSVLDMRTNVLSHFDGGQGLLKRIHFYPAIPYSGLAADHGQRVFVGEARSMEQEGEDDRFILQFQPDGELMTKVAGFRGRVDKLVLDHKDRLYVWDARSAEITMLTLQPRTLHMTWTGKPEGVFISKALDSTEMETIWHKVLLDANIPDETQIRVSYFASDRKRHMINGQFTDLDEWLMDGQTMEYEKLSALASFWSPPLINPKDALIVDMQGRYLWLKIEMMGSEHSTPELAKLRIYFPRTSLLSYLPAVYQEDEQSRHFLERFLALFDTFYQQMEEQIGDIAKFFDRDAAGGEFLRWLSTWLGISQELQWSDEKLRQFMKQAPDIYKVRGTRRALENMLTICTGEPPIIIEYFQLKQMREQSEMRELMSGLFDANPYSFCVLLKPETVRTDQQQFMVRQIIEEQKPAFSEVKIVLLQPWMYMDMHTYLGINTVLSEPTLMHLDHSSSMPHNTIIIDVDQENRMGLHTRLGLDSELD